MHKFSTAATKSFGLTALRNPQAGAPGTRRGQPVADPNRTSSTFLYQCGFRIATRTVRASHRLAPTSLRDKNLCIIRAEAMH